ncbi:MAG: nitroreductase family deazaflavin-dependent oxidoreductase [Chloroflexota bacterium]
MNSVMKVVARIHTTLYQMSGGRIGATMGGQDILMLRHLGAKSGKVYTSPLGYIKDGDAYVVIAAAMGQPNHPGWYHNLKKTPNTTITIGGEKIQVIAEIAPPAKRDELWAKLSADIPHFDTFQAKTSRVIPAILLHPQ